MRTARPDPAGTGLMDERWLPVPVPGFEELYEVSDLGRVRSLDRTVACRGDGQRRIPGRILKLQISNRGGYPAIMLWHNGKYVRRHVHTLVLTAFVGPRPPGQEARHGPAGPLAASLTNLCWGTPSENQMDKVRDGTSNRGERQWQAKLTWPAVAEIRRRVTAGELIMHIAREFGVSPRNIRNIMAGDTWILPVLLRPIEEI